MQSAENEDNGSEEREPALQQNEDDQRSERDVTEEQSDQPTESGKKKNCQLFIMLILMGIY